jgi:hypothetical protein
MTPIKRISLAAVFLLGTTLCASTPTRAQGPSDLPSDWGPVELTNMGAQPQAMGQAWLTDVVYKYESVDGPYGYLSTYPITYTYWYYTYHYEGTLHVTCQHLDPKKNYYLNLPGQKAILFQPLADGTARIDCPAYPAIEWQYTVEWYGEYDSYSYWSLVSAGCFVQVTGKRNGGQEVLEGTVPPPVIPGP